MAILPKSKLPPRKPILLFKPRRQEIADANNQLLDQRATIRKIGGVMPENLPPEPSLKRLTKGPKKITKKKVKSD